MESSKIYIAVWDNKDITTHRDEERMEVRASFSDEGRAKAYCEAMNNKIESDMEKEVSDGYMPSRGYYGRYSYQEVPLNPAI